MRPKYDFQATAPFWTETTHGRVLQDHLVRVDATNKMLLITLERLTTGGGYFHLFISFDRTPEVY